MKLLIDTNIILDILLKREPFYKTASEVLTLAQREDVQEYVSASAITDIHYIAQRQLRDRTKVNDLLKRLLLVVSIAVVSEREIRNALELDWTDFEDSVQYSVALLGEMDAIITRNVKDYKDADIPVMGPDQLLQNLPPLS